MISSGWVTFQLSDFMGVGYFEAKFQVEWLCFTSTSMVCYIGDYKFDAGSLHTNKFCSKYYLIEVYFYSKKEKKTKNCFLNHLLGDLGVMYALHL